MKRKGTIALIVGTTLALLAACGGGGGGGGGIPTPPADPLPDPVYQLTPQFTIQFGTGAADDVWSVVQDSNNNLIVAGSVDGAAESTWSNFAPANSFLTTAPRSSIPPADPPTDLFDGFVGKLDVDGNPLWVRHFDVDGGNDDIWDVAVDSNTGDVYVAGSDWERPFVAKVDTNGGEGWFKHIDIFAGGEAFGVAVDPVDGLVFVVGYNTGLVATPLPDSRVQAFVMSLRPLDGFILDNKNFPSSFGDAVYNELAINADNNQLYIVGETDTANNGVDSIFDIVQYSNIPATLGILAPLSALDSAIPGDDFAYGISQDGDIPDNVYISGEQAVTSGDVTGVVGPAGYLAKFQLGANSPTWSEEIGSTGTDRLFSTAVDPVSGNVFATGSTTGALPGTTAPVGAGALTVAFDQLDGFAYEVLDDAGVAALFNDEVGRSVILNSVTAGEIFVLGVTDGDVDPAAGDQNSGSRDVFLVKYSLSAL